MRDKLTPGKCIAVILVAIATNAFAQPPVEDISGYLPKSEEVAGWTLSDGPRNYRGDDLFLMIDGGADIYHEYGFEQVLSAQYLNDQDKSITMEIYSKATGKLSDNSRFKAGERQGNHYSMVDRRQEFVLIHRTGQYIAIVIGRNQDEVKVLSNQLAQKLKKRSSKK